MSKVYVVQEPLRFDGQNLVPAFDLTPAAEFGQMEVLLPPGNTMLAPVPAMRTLREKLKHFSDDDYLLGVGNTAAIAGAAMVAGYYNHGRVKLLQWDKRLKQYIKVEMDVSGSARLLDGTKVKY